jgi:molybdate transport system ATP-binding protein
MSVSAAFRKRLSAAFAIDVDFTAEAGITILFGPSGAGKTSVLQAVAGLIRPDAGLISIDGRAVFDGARAIDVRPANRQIGYVFQHLALFPHMTVAANLEYGLARQPHEERRRRTRTIAQSFRIEHLLDRRPGAISGGERQRVALARSLVTDPRLLLLDEPLAALDHATQTRIIDDLRIWNRARAIPILYVTHAHREVFALGERVLVLHDGRIVADGAPHAVMDAPPMVELAEAAGFENILDGTVVALRREAGVMTCRISPRAHQLPRDLHEPPRDLHELPLDLEVPITSRSIGAAVRVAIRAGDILVAAEPPHGLSARNVLAGTIRSTRREGHLVRLHVDAGAPLEVHVTPGACESLRLHEHQQVWLVIKTHSCHVLSTI